MLTLVSCFLLFLCGSNTPNFVVKRLYHYFSSLPCGGSVQCAIVQQIDPYTTIPAETNPREVWMGVAKRSEEEVWMQRHRTQVGVAEDAQQIYPDDTIPARANLQEA